MLLIDGVKYHEWTPTNEKEFERIVSEHASEIFGENSIYIDRKLKLQSLSGIGSIPDGYVITFKGAPQWHIIEVELSSHDLYNHIVPQVGRFISGINNLSTQKIVAEAIYHAIISEELLYMRMDKVVQSGEIYKFLADLISKPPVITIVIEKDTPELGDALSALAHPTKNVVELRTFTREEIGLPVHAHLFEPLYKEIGPIRKELTNAEKKEIESQFIFIRVENFWVRYRRLRIASEYLVFLSLSHDMSFELETDVGIINTKIDKWNEICVGMGKWYKAHPELKAGDIVTFRVLEPMKKYRLDIEK